MVETGDQHHAVFQCDAEQRDEPYGCRNREVLPREPECYHSSNESERNVEQDQQRVAHPVEASEEQQKDSEECHRYDEQEALVRFLLQPELSSPGDEIAGWKIDARIDLCLRFLDKRTDVPALNVALDRDEALVLFPGDLTRPDNLFEFHQIRERYLHSVGSLDQD